MITVQELRLGNLVTDPNHYKGEAQVAIDCINYTSETKYWYDGLKPIPLTEERLIKFGLTRKHSSANFSNDKMCVFNNLKSVNIHYAIYGCDYEFECPKYVHQLQNLYFALTGQELTINKI